MKNKFNAEKITDIKVKSLVGTLVLTGTDGDYDAEKNELWVKQEGSQEHNNGPQEGTEYNITFAEKDSPVKLKFKGRFAGAGYEFKKS